MNHASARQLCLTSLSQLENVLLPINNLQLPIRHPQTNISTMKPPLLINRLFSLLLIFIVSLEHVGATNANLTSSSAWLAVMRCV
jgi:hypothetical protein